MACANNFDPWTQDLNEVLITLREEKLPMREIASQLGRTLNAVRSQIRKIDLPRRTFNRQNVCETDAPEPIRLNIPEHVLIDRFHRMSAPRTLTAVMLGDPPFPAQPNNPAVLA